MVVHPQISICQSPEESGGKELETLILSTSTDGLRGGLGSCSSLLILGSLAMPAEDVPCCLLKIKAILNSILNNSEETD